MFVVINNEAFKCTDLMVSKIIEIPPINHRGIINVYAGTAKTDDKREILMANHLVSQKRIEIKKLEDGDELTDTSKWSDPGAHEHHINPTETVYLRNNVFYLMKHPANTVYVFCIYDEEYEHFTVSKIYSSLEECTEARDRILEHCNNIYYSLPREEV